MAIADSGAEICTAPLHSITGTPFADNIHTAPAHTAIQYGNSTIVSIEHQTIICETTVQLTPNHCSIPLIAIIAPSKYNHHQHSPPHTP